MDALKKCESRSVWNDILLWFEAKPVIVNLEYRACRHARSDGDEFPAATRTPRLYYIKPAALPASQISFL